MAHCTIVLPLLTAFLLILYPCCFRNLVTAKIVLPLIHRDSIFSPNYKIKPNEVISPVPLVLEPAGYMFLVNISIGEPPVPQLMLMDGGSSFIWVCNKCNNAYNHLKSSTYNRVRCHSNQDCKNYNNIGDICTNTDCTYKITYADKSMSRGYLAKEQFTFQTNQGNILPIPGILIGRATRMTKWVGPRVGIFGLEPGGKDSLTSFLGSIYSYCLGNISDPSYQFNELILGDGAKINDGNTTPLKYLNGHYLVDFRGITVDGKLLDIDEKELGYNLLIDSGSAYTWLRESVYNLLRSRIEEIFRLNFFEDPFTDEEDDLCYEGNIVRDLKGFSRVILRLAENAELDLGEEALFIQREPNIFCLALAPVKEPDGINILGIYAQQYHYFGFNMIGNVLHFQYVDCEVYDYDD